MSETQTPRRKTRPAKPNPVQARVRRLWLLVVLLLITGVVIIREQGREQDRARNRERVLRLQVGQLHLEYLALRMAYVQVLADQGVLDPDELTRLGAAYAQASESERRRIDQLRDELATQRR